MVPFENRTKCLVFEWFEPFEYWISKKSGFRMFGFWIPTVVDNLQVSLHLSSDNFVGFPDSIQIANQ